MRIDGNVSATNGNVSPVNVSPFCDANSQLQKRQFVQAGWGRGTTECMAQETNAQRTTLEPHTVTHSLTDTHTHTLAHAQNHAIEEIQLYWVTVWNIECGVVG